MSSLYSVITTCRYLIHSWLLVIDKENTDEPVTCKGSTKYLLCPSWCEYDENGQKITEDLEMVNILLISYF